MFVESFFVVTTFPPGLTVTVYLVILDPPADFGAFQLRLALFKNPVPLIPVGRPGPARSFAADEGAEATPEPTELSAVTVNV